MDWIYFTVLWFLVACIIATSVAIWILRRAGNHLTVQIDWNHHIQAEQKRLDWWEQVLRKVRNATAIVFLLLIVIPLVAYQAGWWMP